MVWSGFAGRSDHRSLFISKENKYGGTTNMDYLSQRLQIFISDSSDLVPRRLVSSGAHLSPGVYEDGGGRRGSRLGTGR